MLNPFSLRQAWSALPALAFLFTNPPTAVRAQTSLAISNLWSISTAAGRPYLTNAAANSYTERGVAYNALNNHAYIVSRASTAGGLRVAILDGDTGADLGTLNVTGVSGGTFALSTIGVADDGSIYAANLTTGSATTPYKIYRWVDELAAPLTVFSGNPSVGANANRYGESLDVRGSGLDTEIIASANGAAIVAIFKPTDLTLTSFASTRLDVTGTGAGDLTKGISFGPTNTFYGKNNGNAFVRFCSYNLGAGTATLLGSFTVASGVAPIDVDPVRNILAGVESANALSPHNLRVYDLSTGPAPSQLFSTAFPPPAANNGNIVGEAQIAGDRIFAIDTQNGVVMAKIYVLSNAVPPSITQQPVSQSVIEGGYVTFTVGANGTKPLSYQWYHEASAISGADTNFLNLTNVTMADAGNYSVVITNVAGSTNSTQAALTVIPSLRSSALSNCWQLPPNSRPWITTDNNQRGLAYNPATGHLLVVSRSPTNAIYVLDAATGAQLYTLNVDPTIITGGTFAINLIGVDNDGRIYAANLTTGAAGTPFKLYRWGFEDPEVAPTVAYSGDPANGTGGTTSVRWGDNMDVRGSFPVQVLLGSRAGNQAAVLSSVDDGVSFTSAPITTDAPNGDIGLGVAFGADDTFWGKAGGSSLRHIAFDLVGGTGTTLQTFGTGVFPGAVTVIGVDVARNYLAGLSIETPDNIRFYSIQDLANPPVWHDTEFLLTDNANANGTGAFDFGAGKLFALDSNNGLAAYAIVPPPPAIICQANKTVDCGTAWTFDRPSVKDLCDGTNVALLVTSTVTNALCGNTFTATRTWQATNTCGLSSPTCSQTVTVVDTNPPAITCQPNKIVDCGTAWTFDPPAVMDSCDGTNVTIAVFSTVTNNIDSSATRTWIATDACGNSSMCSQTVTNLSQNPALDSIPNRTVHAGAHVIIVATGTNLVNPTFSLAPGAPASAVINPTNGVLIWETSAADANSSRSITVQVTAGCPASAATPQTFTVTVVPRPIVTIARSGNSNELSWTAIPGNSYFVLYTTNLGDTNGFDLLNTNAIVATGGTASLADAIGPDSQRFYTVTAADLVEGTLCTIIRHSIGFGNVVDSVRSTNPAVVTAALDNRAGSGGFTYHCVAAGQAIIIYHWTDAAGVKHTSGIHVTCK